MILMCSCEKTEPKFEYEKVDGGIMITGYNGSSTEINIPEQIKGKNVVSIGEKAFEFTTAEKITVPKTVTSIGSYAFRQSSTLKTVNILGEIKAIMPGMFNFCVNLTEFQVPDGVETIGENAFGGSGIEEVILPDSVKEIEEYAYYSCVSLKTFKSGSGLEKLGNSCFGACISLSDITLNEGLKEVGEGCFSSCSALKEIAVPTTVETLEPYVFSETTMEKYSVSEGIKTIRSYAFADCKSLGWIYIPESVTKMEKDVFNGTKDVVICGIPDSMAEIYADYNGLDFEKYSENK